MKTDAIELGTGLACLTGECEHHDYERCFDAIRDHVNEMQSDAKSLAIDRCNWKSACEYIMTVISEGGAKGRPMDLIDKRSWDRLMRLKAIAENGLGPEDLENDV